MKWFILAFTSFVICLFVFARLSSESPTANQNELEVVSVKTGNSTGSYQSLNKVPLNPWHINTTDDRNNYVELIFLKPDTPKYVRISFSQRITSRFSIYLRSLDGRSWKQVGETSNHNQSFAEFTISNKDRFVTSGIRLVFQSANLSDHSFQIENLRVFGDADWLSNIFNLSRSPLNYAIYVLVISWSVFVMGAGLLKNKLKSPVGPDGIALILTVGIVVVASIGTFSLLISNRIIGNILFVLIIAFCLIRVIRVEKIQISKYFMLLLTFIFALMLITFYFVKDQYPDDVTLKNDFSYDYAPSHPIPYGAFEIDYILPFSVSKILDFNLNPRSELAHSLMNEYRISDRTPLLSLFSIPFLHLFGQRFFVFEMISIVTALPLIFAVWCLLNVIFGIRIANLAALFLPLNHWLFFAAHFAQIRLLTLFFMCLFLTAMVKLINRPDSARNKRGLVIFASLAFLSHPFSLVYIASGTILYLAYTVVTRGKPDFKSLSLLVLVILALFFLWTAWSKTQPGESLFVATATSSSWAQATRIMTSGSGLDLNYFKTYAASLPGRWANLLGIIFVDPVPGVVRAWGFLRTTIWGAISLSLLPFFLAGLMVFGRKAIWISLFFLSIVVLTVFIFLGFYAIIGLNWYFLGIIPVATGLAVLAIDRAGLVLKILVYLVSCAEYLYVTWLQFPVEAGNNLRRLLNENSLSRLILLFIVIQIFTLNILFMKMSRGSRTTL